MESKKFLVTPAPHLFHGDTVPTVMLGVLIALIPATLASVYFFGLAALTLILVCGVSCVITEAIWMIFRKKEVFFTIKDCSAFLTGVLLAMTLPPTTPIWAAILGSFVAISLGKHVFGGLGFNIFNPALVGRAFLTASFPLMMTDWVFDGTTTATPLGILASQGETTSLWGVFWGSVGGCIGETSALALLIGAAYLLYKGIIDWRMPVGYLGSVAVLTLIVGQNPIFHLFAGGLMLGAWFMITDPVTSPLSKKARWVYAIGAGLLVFVIRYFGDAPEGVLYSILLMNMTVPLLDRYLPDKVFGEVKAK